MRADEWGGEADKLGHTNVAFLGNAVKTLEERSWVAARAYNWGRAASSPLDFHSGARGMVENLRCPMMQKQVLPFRRFLKKTKSCKI